MAKTPAKKRVSRKNVVGAPVVKEQDIRAVTQADLDRHPEWHGNINVGDMVDFAEVVDIDHTDTPKEEVVVKGKDKVKGLFAVVTKGGEYIRVYEDEDLAEQFANKYPNVREVVDASEITELSVSFDVLDPKSGVISIASKKFSFAKNGASWRDDAVRFSNETRGTCKYK